jgi:hypothetical protein
MDAFAAKDQGRAGQVLHPNMTFVGPIDTFGNAADYLASIQRLEAIVTRINRRKVVAEGNDVCVVYDLVTNTPAGTSRVAQWFHVEGNQITAIEAFFDARPFAAMFGG